MMEDTEAEGKRQAEQAEVVTELAEARVRVTLRPEEINVGDVYKGVVSFVHTYGAFVDYGAQADGFVHMSEITGPPSVIAAKAHKASTLSCSRANSEHQLH
eukprot:1194064-Prorocentrum_minimum.AAC.1